MNRLTEVSGELESLLDHVGASITLEEYANCNQELDTCQPLEKDWEENLQATLREEESSAVLEDETDMEAADPNNMPVVTVKTAATYLQELRVYGTRKSRVVRTNYQESDNIGRDYVKKGYKAN